jgi:tripeptidyl-peptidase-1
MHISKVALLVAAFVLADAASIPVSHVVHEKRDLTPRKFQKRDRLASGAILPVRIGLAQSNLHKGYDHLMDV